MASTGAAVAETQAADPKTKSSNKIRKRAPKACLSCRARKVRCDVSQRGRPCMNCYLDSETCVVTGRASRLRRSLQESNDNVPTSQPPYVPEDPNPNPTAEEVVKSRDIGRPVPERSNSVLTPEDGNHRHEAGVAPSPQTTAGVASPQSASRATPFNPPSHPFMTASHPAGVSTQQLGAAVNPWASLQPVHVSSDIVYTYYPFLNISNLHNILPQDVNFLESQGCFRVPTRAVLDEFVQQYFLHVHPFLPVLHEGEFWDLYCQHGPTGSVLQQRKSLLVFQALIFSACNFVSRNSIKALGYPSIRTARAALYRKAKLLYDFESESSPICIGQAALLLSYWSPINSSGFIRKANSAWLNIAIQQAKVAEAHHYSSFGISSSTNVGPDRSASATQQKRQNVLKRLWWCCIIRDRILALCVRRSIQITRAHFDFDSQSPLGAADLVDEVDRSKVYNSDTKRALIEILAQLIDLCVLLTDVLVLVYPLDDTPGWGRQMKLEEIGRVKDGKIALRRWYKGAALKFPMFGGRPAASANNVAGVGAGGRREFRHDSVILYTNLMYMYYHSGRVALCHHEVLHLAVASAQVSADGTNSGVTGRDVSTIATISENRHELQDAASGVTECLKELIQLRLARWLPISAVACTALPLVLHILDVKLSSPRPGSVNTNGPNSKSALKQHRLNILIEAMKTYQPQYDGVDWVSETIRHIVNLAQLDGAPSNPAGGSSGDNASPESNSNGSGKIHDWTDILTSHPSLYLRLALTMDLSLSKDRIPEEGDFPASLRGLLTGGSSNISTRSMPGRNEQQQQLRPVPGSLSSLPKPGHPPKTGRQTAPRVVAPLHTMKQWLDTDRAVGYGIESGIDMSLDEEEGVQVPEQGGLPSSMYSDSDDSDSCSSSVSHHHDQRTKETLPYEQQQQSDQMMAGSGSFLQPFTFEEMELLEAHVLDAFTLQNESPPSSEGAMEALGIFGEALGLDVAGDWFEQVGKARDREGQAGGGARENGDSAKALLDAMEE